MKRRWIILATVVVSLASPLWWWAGRKVFISPLNAEEAELSTWNVHFDDVPARGHAKNLAAVIVEKEDPKKETPTDGNKNTSLTANQLACASYVASLGVLSEKIHLGEQEVAVSTQQTEVGNDPSITGYRLDPNGEGFEVYTATRTYHAQKVSETLFLMDSPHIFPLGLLDGKAYVVVTNTQGGAKQPEIRPYAQIRRAPGSLTVYGIVDGPVGAVTDSAIAKSAGFKKQAELVLENPTRANYEAKRKELVGNNKVPLNATIVTEYTSSLNDMAFQLSTSASFGLGGFFSGSTTFNQQRMENIEQSAVYQMIRQAAYTVAVDSPPPPAAGWFHKDLTVEQLKQSLGTSPPVYVESVTYGRCAMLVATSSKKNTDLKEGMAALASANFIFSGSGSVSWSSAQRTAVESATFKIILYGGGSDPASAPQLHTLTFPNAMKMLTDWYNADFRANQALPIAFTTRFLTDHSSAGFIGLHPHRFYRGNVVEAKYEVRLETYYSPNDSDWFGPFGKGSRIILMSATNGKGPFKRLYKKLDGTGLHHIHEKLDGVAGVGAGSKFAVNLRFTTKDGDSGGEDWEDMHKGKWGKDMDIPIDLGQLNPGMPPNAHVSPIAAIILNLNRHVVGPIEFNMPKDAKISVSVQVLEPPVPYLPTMPKNLRAFK